MPGFETPSQITGEAYSSGRELGFITGQIFINFIDYPEIYVEQGLDPHALQERLLEDLHYDPTLISDAEFVTGVRRGVDEWLALRDAGGYKARRATSGSFFEMPKVASPSEAQQSGSRWPETGTYFERSSASTDVTGYS